MNNYQIITIVVLSLLIVICVAMTWRGRLSRKEGFLWCGLWMTAGIATLWPEMTTRIAKLSGIGRGADLVSYSGIVVMFVGFWVTYLHLHRLQREFTVLVRKLALMEAERELLSAGPPPTSES